MLRAGEVDILAGPSPRVEVCNAFAQQALWDSLR
jgi:hypothetical protein